VTNLFVNYRSKNAFSEAILLNLIYVYEVNGSKEKNRQKLKQ